MEIRSVSKDLWGMFSRYHYLTHTVSNSSKFYAGFINGEPVAIVAINKFPHHTAKDIYKVGRIVTLPHWQGYGIGNKLVEHVVDNYYKDGRVRITTTLPIMHNYYYNSPKWKLVNQSSAQPKLDKNAQFKSQTRQVYTETYQYIREGQGLDTKITRRKVPAELRKDDSWKLTGEQPKPVSAKKLNKTSSKKSGKAKVETNEGEEVVETHNNKQYVVGLANAPEIYTISNEAVGEGIQLEEVNKEYYVQQVEALLELWFGPYWKDRVENAHAKRKQLNLKPLPVKNYIN